MFKDREDAARRLLQRLKRYRGERPLVLGIPRGAMGMAKIIADGLDGELGAVLVRKVPAPGNEELAIGSVGLSGHVVKLSRPDTMDIPDSYLYESARRQLETLKQRQKKFGLVEPGGKGRTVIVVDDGIATGATTMAAIHEVRSQHPKKLVLATAVCSPRMSSRIRAMVDEFVVLSEPEWFSAVSQLFENFPQVTDDEVVLILNSARNSPPSGA